MAIFLMDQMFMLQAICEQSNVTKDVFLKMMPICFGMKKRLKTNLATIYIPDFLEHIFSYPVTYPTHMAEKMGISYQTASKYLSILEEGGGVLGKQKSGRHMLYYNISLLACLKN